MKIRMITDNTFVNNHTYWYGMRLHIPQIPDVPFKGPKLRSTVLVVVL
eukprot:COSAG02_NODE_3986_length_5948_cov_1.918619_4_plen_48_part_00